VEVGRGIEDEAGEGMAVDPLLGGKAEEVENGRHHVHRRDLGRAPAVVAPGRADDEGDVLGRVVDEEGVRALPVVAEALPVIGHEHEYRAVPDALRLEPGHEPSHHLVRVGDLPEVGLSGVELVEGSRRLVGSVRVVEVDPGEETAGLHGLQPREGEIHDLVALLLDGAEVDDLVLREVEAVGVVVEPLVEAPARVEHPRADERSRRPARLLQPLRERHRLCLEEEAAVVADAVMGRNEAGEDRGVRGQGHRGGGGRLLEDDALARDGVDVRRLDAREAVAAEAVGAQRVERDEDEVERSGRGVPAGETLPGVGGTARRAGSQSPPPRGRGQESEEGDGDHPGDGAPPSRGTPSSRHHESR
jgi:hypothetical protein